jgi:sugar lactone lactonase YvrE
VIANHRRPKAAVRARDMGITLAVALATVGSVAHVHAQALPNPYRQVEGWAKLPGGRQIGAVGDVDIDVDGRHVWAVLRCDAGGDKFGYECLESDLDVVVKFAPDGNAVESFGGGMFIWPHGIEVDAQGNVWVTDAASAERTAGPAARGRGHQVVQFSPKGEVLMRLGTAGVPGNDATHFNAPSDVVVAANGDIFVADGHGDATNNRVVKFGSSGTFIKAWGRTGYAPGEFRTLHAIAIDARGRVFVGDRQNNRIQIFDQDGMHLATWTQFGRAERHLLRPRRPHRRGRLRVRQQREPRLGDGHSHRRRGHGLGARVHSLSMGRPARSRGHGGGVRGRGPRRQPLRRRAAAAAAPEVRARPAVAARG